MKLPLRFADSGNNPEYGAETFNISAKGVGFITKEKLNPNTSIEMWLEIPDNHQPLFVSGKVVWTDKAQEQGKQRVGINLDQANLMGLARTFRL